MRQNFIFLVLFIFVVLVLFSCEKEKPVKIAIMTKIESGSIVGSSEVNAARFFIEEKNIKNIEIIPFDDGWDSEKSKIAYENVKKQGIKILITSHVSTSALAIADSINKDKILTFVTGATTNILSKKDDYIIRNILDVELEQKQIAEFINNTPEKKLLIVRDSDNFAYTEPALKYFTDFYKKELFRKIDISISKLDIAMLEEEMKKDSFDVVYILIGGYKSVSGSIGQLAKKLNQNVKIIYTPWMKTPALLETAGDSIENSIIPAHYPPKAENPKILNYIDRFKKKYSHAPTFISLNVYSALEIIYEAIQAGNKTPEEIKSYIISKKKFTTEFGSITFDEYGDTEMPLFFIKNIKEEF